MSQFLRNLSCFRALLGHGIPLHELEGMLTDDEPLIYQPTSCTSMDTRWAKSNWCVQYSRNQAIELRRPRKDGTFLIRPGSQDNPYSLSIV